MTVDQRRGRRVCPRPAFSLVELCAGLACFGALFAIAQPSLEVARERAKQAVCLDRLRSIGQATGLYTEQDPSGWSLPVHSKQFDHEAGDTPTFIGAYEWGGKSGTLSTNSPYLRPLARVPNPARTLFYEENISRWTWPASSRRTTASQ